MLFFPMLTHLGYVIFPNANAFGLYYFFPMLTHLGYVIFPNANAFGLYYFFLSGKRLCQFATDFHFSYAAMG
jgi:hypothetical protein